MVNAELNCKCELLSSYWAVSLSWRSWFWWETCSVKFGIVFFSGKEDPPAEEESHTSRFPFVFTEIWRQYGFITVTSPSCNCFSMDSCARQDRNPASLLFFPLYNYPSKAVALLTTRLSLLQPGRRSCREISRRWACRYSLGTAQPPLSRKSQLLPDSTEEIPGCCPPQSLSHAPEELCWLPWLSRRPRCHLTAGHCQEQFPADSWFVLLK